MAHLALCTGVPSENTLRILFSQPSPKAFSARSILDSTESCDVAERHSPALSQTSGGQRGKRERLGTRLLFSMLQ